MLEIQLVYWSELVLDTDQNPDLIQILTSDNMQ